MEDWVLLVLAGLLVLLQLAISVFTKKIWLQWLPSIVTILLIVFCFVMYSSSGEQANWGYIILIALLGIVLMLQTLIRWANRLIRWILGLTKK